MRQETNNEMDLLLRRLGRRQDVFTHDAGDHLDMDELNAYAENAVPAAARARYTEHLAECSPCRELVVQLSASAGVAIAPQPATVPEPSGLKKFLASLLSPMVLRYAAPALGLIVVAAIGVMMLRQNTPTGDYVFQVQNEQAKPATPLPSDTGPQARPYYDSAANSPDSTASREDLAKKNGSQPTPTAKSEEAPAVVAQNAPAPKPESQPVTVAAEPPAAKVDVASADKQQQNEETRQKEAEIKVARDEVSKKNLEFEKSEKRTDARTRIATPSAAAKSKTISEDGASVGSVAAGVANVSRGRGQRDDDSKDSSAETKSVAGRTFRKRAGVWIDTAYDSSPVRMTVSRGSEGYKSLIADEPGIKTIADQLDGEIIVVWKGRPYRIR